MKKFFVAYDYTMEPSGRSSWRHRWTLSANGSATLTVFSTMPAWWGSAGFEDSVREFTLDRLGADWLGRTDSTERE